MASSQQVQDFSIRSTMPAGDVLALDAKYPGFLDAQINLARSAYIYGRLRKRYNVSSIDPNANPPGVEPEIVKAWIAAIVTPIAYNLRGVQMSDVTIDNINKGRDDALKALQEAADSENGLYDLPLLAADPSITVGGPLGYSEPSPYEWQRRQLEAVRCRR
jgi:hypothetical protein